MCLQRSDTLYHPLRILQKKHIVMKKREKTAHSEIDCVDETMNKLELYLDGLRARGEKLPKCVFQERPHFRAISAASGVDFGFLLSQPYKQRITLAIQEIGFTQNEKSHWSKLNERFEQNCQRLSNYFSWLEVRGEKLPENPEKRGEVFFAQIEIEAALTPDALRLKNTESDKARNLALHQIIKDVVPQLGVEVRVLLQSPGERPSQISYKQLLESGTKERDRELIGKRGARQQRYNTRSALNKFCEVLNLDQEGPVGSELTINFKAATETVMDKIKEESTRKKFQTEINWWHEFYRRQIKCESMPSDFLQTLVHIVSRSGLSLPVIAKLIGVKTTVLRKWHAGISTPSLLSIESIYRMEKLFRLPSGILTNKIPGKTLGKRFKLSNFPEFLRENKSLAHAVSNYLPDDFCERPEMTQREIVESIRTTILRGDDPYSLRLQELSKLPYKLTKWPLQLRQEFDPLAAYKMGDRTPIGMRRKGRWRETTKDKVESHLASLFGAICLSNESEDERVRGLAVPKEHLTLAFIACPLLIDWYTRFICSVRNEYTDDTICFIRDLMSFLRRRYGWLRQMPQLAQRLRPVLYGTTELVSEDLILIAQTDWNKVCDDAIEYYIDLIEEIQPLVTVSRDPFLKIAGILDMEDPMKMLEMLTQGLKNDMPNRLTQTTYYHLAIRDRVLILLINITGLRRTTIVKLDFTGTGIGHLFKQSGRYMLKIPRQFFKVEDSPFFGPKRSQDDYHAVLPDVYELYDLLDEYTTTSIPWLLNKYYPNCKEHPLFVNSGLGKSARMRPERVSGIYTQATARYLVENRWRGTGIPNVSKHGPQSARHIRGSAAYRKTRLHQDSADANHNSVRMSKKHYTRTSTKERNDRVNEILFPPKKVISSQGVKTELNIEE